MANIFENWTKGPDTVMPSELFVTDNLNSTVKLRFLSDGEKYPPTTLMTELKRIVDQKPDHPFTITSYSNDEFETVTYGDFWNQARKAAKSLIKLGVTQVDCVSIFSLNCSKYLIVQFGTLFCGGVLSGYNALSSIEAIEICLNDTCSKMMFVENSDSLKKILAIKSKNFDKIIQMYGPIEENDKIYENLIDWDTFMNIGLNVDEIEVEKRLKTIAPNKCATLCFTSGTTGKPKASMSSHDNWIHQARNFQQRCTIFEERFISKLPFTNMSGQFQNAVVILCGGTHYFVGTITPENVIDKLKFVKPTVLLSVIQFYQLLQKRYEMHKKITNDKNLTAREYMGLECCHTIGIGGNIPPQQLMEYFQNLNIPLLNGFGSTEVGIISTSFEVDGPMSIGRLNESFKIGDNDELLCNGRTVFMGYLNGNEKNKASFDDEHWFRTGDIAKVNERGELTINGRLKDILKIGTSVPVSPVYIEEEIKRELYLFVSCCILVGDGEDYLSALIALRCKTKNGIPVDELEDQVIQLLNSFKLNITKLSEASQISIEHPFMKWLEEKIKIANKKYAIDSCTRTAYAEVKKFAILPREFSLLSGELNLLNKMVRPVITKNFKDIIDKLYNHN